MVLKSFVSLHLYIAELPLQYWEKLQHASYVRRTKVIIKLHKGVHDSVHCMRLMWKEEVLIRKRRMGEKWSWKDVKLYRTKQKITLECWHPLFEHYAPLNHFCFHWCLTPSLCCNCPLSPLWMFLPPCLSAWVLTQRSCSCDFPGDDWQVWSVWCNPGCLSSCLLWEQIYICCHSQLLCLLCSWPDGNPGMIGGHYHCLGQVFHSLNIHLRELWS